MTTRGDLPIHVEAFLRETRGMSHAEVGAHIRLVGHAWLNSGDGSLPDDPAELARIAGVTPRHWSTVAPIVLKLWPLHLDNRRRTQLLENVLGKIREFSEKQRARIRKRWAQQSTRAVEKPVETCAQIDLGETAGPLKRKPNPLKLNGAHHTAVIPNLKKESQNLTTSQNPAYALTNQADAPPNNKSKNLKKGFAEGEAAPHRPASNAVAKIDMVPRSHTGNPRQAWEHELARLLGPDAYAEAIPILNSDQALCQRATAAERRQSGSGAMVAAIGLRQGVVRRPP